MDEQDEPQDDQAPEPQGQPGDEEPEAEEPQAAQPEAGGGGAPGPPPPPKETPGPPPARARPKPDVGRYLSRAWELVKADPVLFIVGNLVISAISGATGGILFGPLMFGFVRVAQKRLDGEPAEFGELFSGFKDFGKGFITWLLLALIGIPLALVWIIAIVLMIFVPCIGWLLGFLLLVASMLFVMAGCYFIIPVAALSDVPPVDAVKNSFRFCFADFWQVLLLSLVMSLVGMAGMLVCGIGVYLTAPIAMVASVVAYQDYYLPNAPEAG